MNLLEKISMANAALSNALASKRIEYAAQQAAWERAKTPWEALSNYRKKAQVKKRLAVLEDVRAAKETLAALRKKEKA